jgi:hypothetical protein
MAYGSGCSAVFGREDDELRIHVVRRVAFGEHPAVTTPLHSIRVAVRSVPTKAARVTQGVRWHRRRLAGKKTGEVRCRYFTKKYLCRRVLVEAPPLSLSQKKGKDMDGMNVCFETCRQPQQQRAKQFRGYNPAPRPSGSSPSSNPSKCQAAME